MIARMIQIKDTKIYVQDLGAHDQIRTGDVRLVTGDVVDPSWSGLPVGESGLFARPLLADDDIKALYRLANARYDPVRNWAIAMLREIGALS